MMDLRFRVLHYCIMGFVFALATVGLVFHYRNALGLGYYEYLLIEIHVYIAYGFLTTLLARLVLGLKEPAKFAMSRSLPRRRDFAGGWNQVGEAVTQSKRIRFAGRSSVSRLLSGFFYVSFLVMAVTGLIRAGSDLYHYPVGYFVRNYIVVDGADPSTIKPESKENIDRERLDKMLDVTGKVGRVHYWTALSIIGVVAVHVAGQLFFEWSRPSGKGSGGAARVMLLGNRRRQSKTNPDD